MKLIFIRHGDPDYSIDSLTEKGWKEAELLAEKMSKLKVDRCYVSPLGRAKDTAGCYLKKAKAEAKTLSWLQEFRPKVARPHNPEHLTVAWDWLPKDWANEDIFYDYNEWMNHPLMKEAGVPEEIKYVYEKFADLLKELGYEKKGRLFNAVKPNNDTIVFFCHFGITCVLLGYLLNISPMVLWHTTCSAPTSVTVVNTEERVRGMASFRMASFGDVSHLYAAGEEPAFAARFCECFDNYDERH